MKSYLEKQGLYNTAAWKSRWCVLEGNEMIYYRDKDFTHLQGRIQVADSRIVDERPNSEMEFQIETHDRTHVFRALGKNIKAQWVASLRIASKPMKKQKSKGSLDDLISTSLENSERVEKKTHSHSTSAWEQGAMQGGKSGQLIRVRIPECAGSGFITMRCPYATSILDVKQKTITKLKNKGISKIGNAALKVENIQLAKRAMKHQESSKVENIQLKQQSLSRGSSQSKESLEFDLKPDSSSKKKKIIQRRSRSKKKTPPQSTRNSPSTSSTSLVPQSNETLIVLDDDSFVYDALTKERFQQGNQQPELELHLLTVEEAKQYEEYRTDGNNLSGFYAIMTNHRTFLHASSTDDCIIQSNKQSNEDQEIFQLNQVKDDSYSITTVYNRYLEVKDSNYEWGLQQSKEQVTPDTILTPNQRFTLQRLPDHKYSIKSHFQTYIHAENPLRGGKSFTQSPAAGPWEVYTFIGKSNFQQYISKTHQRKQQLLNTTKSLSLSSEQNLEVQSQQKPEKKSQQNLEEQSQQNLEVQLQQNPEKKSQQNLEEQSQNLEQLHQNSKEQPQQNPKEPSQQNSEEKSQQNQDKNSRSRKNSRQSLPIPRGYYVKKGRQRSLSSPSSPSGFKNRSKESYFSSSRQVEPKAVKKCQIKLLTEEIIMLKQENNRLTKELEESKEKIKRLEEGN